MQGTAEDAARRRSSAARKSSGKRVTKTGDSGKGSTRKSDVRKPGRPPKPAPKRSGGTRRSPPGAVLDGVHAARNA